MYIYHPDYSKYDDVQQEVYNIGWLHPSNDYNKGTAGATFFEKLTFIYENEDDVNLMRGINICPFCPKERGLISMGENDKFLLGHSEIWVPNKLQTKIFVAPSMIIHYVSEHKYLPPQEFIDAVLDFDFSSGWSGKTAFLNLMDEIDGPHDWGGLR